METLFTTGPAKSASALVPAFLGGASVALRSSSSRATGELFSEELEGAVQRQGGERAVEERLFELADARRSDRREGFERYRDRVSDSRRKGSTESESSASSSPPREAEPPVETRSRPQKTPHAEPAAETTSAKGSSGERAPLARSEPAAVPASETQASARPDPNGAAGAQGQPGVVGQGTVSASATAAGAAPKVSPAISVIQGSRAEKLLESLAAERVHQPDLALLERAEQVLKQIRLAIQPRAKRVTLELSPNDLGRLAIRITLRKGELSTVVRAESPQTLALLELRAPELCSLLAQHGFDATRMEFELGFGERRERFAPPDEDFGLDRSAPAGCLADSSTCPSSLSASSPRVSAAVGIDTYA